LNWLVQEGGEVGGRQGRHLVQAEDLDLARRQGVDRGGGEGRDHRGGEGGDLIRN